MSGVPPASSWRTSGDGNRTISDVHARLGAAPGPRTRAHPVSVCFGRTALRVKDRPTAENVLGQHRRGAMDASSCSRDAACNCPACHRARRTRWKTIEAEANANYRGLLPYPVWVPGRLEESGQGRPLRVWLGIPDDRDGRGTSTDALRRVPATTSDAPPHRTERILDRVLTDALGRSGAVTWRGSVTAGPMFTRVARGPMRYGRIISLSSCSTMWQCHTNWPGVVEPRPDAGDLPGRR